MPEATWKPQEKHGHLTMQSDLPDSVYAFPKQRKEPLTDAQHVRTAVARFDQVIDVSDADRALAFANIEKAANYYGVNLAETVMARPGRPSPEKIEVSDCLRTAQRRRNMKAVEWDKPPSSIPHVAYSRTDSGSLRRPAPKPLPDPEPGQGIPRT